MAIKGCCGRIDEHGRELVRHGTVPFPVACYQNDLTQNTVPWHWHDELEVVFVTEGTVVFTAGAEQHVLGSGCGLFINAGVLHGARSGGSRCRIRSLVFHPRLVGGGLDSIFWQDYVRPLLESQERRSVSLHPDTDWGKSVLEALKNAWEACAAQSAGYPFRVRAELSNVLFLLLENCRAHSPVPSRKALRDGERIKTMLQYIQENYEKTLCVAQIAASANISESECLRCFQTTIGTAPVQYVRQLRVQRAAELLVDTDLQISEIGEQCGFQEMSYFSRVFRQQMDTSPGMYRKRYRE